MFKNMAAKANVVVMFEFKYKYRYFKSWWTL